MNYNSAQASAGLNAAISFSVVKYLPDAPSGGVNPHENLILTNLVDTAGPRPTLGPILYLHGARTDWTSFFAADTSGGGLVPIPVRLALAGYDVFMATRRGGLYQTDCDDGARCVDDDTYWTDVYAQEIGALDIPDLIDLIIRERGSLNSPSCQKVTLIAHSLATQEAMHALNISANISDYVETLINLAPCAVARRDWSGFPQPPTSRRILSDVLSDDGHRKLLTTAEWPDYKAAKKVLRACLAADDYLAFYNALRTAIKADPTAWNADWRTVFDAVLDAGSYTDGTECSSGGGYTPDPALWAFWSGYMSGFSAFAPSSYGPTWDTAWEDFCTVALLPSLPQGFTCAMYREMVLGESCYSGGTRAPRSDANEWPNCNPESHNSLLLEAMTNAWYGKWVDIAAGPDYANPSTEPPQFDWTNL